MSIELGNRLAALRKEHGYSQEDLAAKLGVSRQAISKWECGESAPDTDNLIALSKIYGITLDELVYGKEAETNEQAIEVDVNKDVVDGGIPQAELDADAPKKPFRRIIGFIYGSGFFIALIAYFLCGFLWKGPTGALGWASMWILFLMPIVVGSLFSAISNRKWSDFQFPVLITAVYCAMGIIGGAYGVNLWHPFWLLFLLIPIHSSLAHTLDNHRHF